MKTNYFKKRGIGPLIGTRTWGGLIGISGAPNLIDNGRITMPTFRMYDPNGEWFKEGHGVDADIEIVEDFQQLANGTDVQLEAAINEVIKLLSNLESMTFTEIRTQLNLGQYELLRYLRTLLHEKTVRINNCIKPARWFIVKENHG